VVVLVDKSKYVCAMPKCKIEPEVLYYGDYWVCKKHWTEHCKGKIDLKQQFRIKERAINADNKSF